MFIIAKDNLSINGSASSIVFVIDKKTIVSYLNLNINFTVFYEINFNSRNFKKLFHFVAYKYIF